MIDLKVYYVTGRQLGPISVPSSWCRECDVTIRLVESLVAELGDKADIRLAVEPWLRHVVGALSRGAWHPPIVVVNGRVFSQGVVPDREMLRAALEQASDESSDAPRGCEA